MLKTSKYVFLLLIVLSLSTVLACSNSSPAGPGGKTTSATVSVDVQAPSQAPSKASQKFVGTINDITSIAVDVLRGGTPLITGQQLIYGNGVWSGTLENLPIGPSLTFIGHAYNASAVEIFTGTTVQAMTGTNDSVTILMAPVDDGVPAMFPRIARIMVPAQIVTSSTVTIGIVVEGSYGDTLVYTIYPGGGGSFNPPYGSIFLPDDGNTATIVVSYTSPSTAGTFTNSVRIYNNQGNWVETDFATVVAGTASPSVSVQFAPVITAIGAKRTGSDVTFAAVVSDTAPTTLTYSWGFDGGLTFVNNTTNPAVLQGYDETKSGNLTLTVTNGAGGATTVSYYIAPGLLPDSIVVTRAAAQWARSVTAGNNESDINSVSVAPDGSVYAAGSIDGNGTFDFGNGITAAGTSINSNVLLVKYNSSGTAQWAQTVTVGSSNSWFDGVSVASDGSVYAAGRIYGTETFNFGNGITAAGTSINSNVLLVKYNSSGAAQWARTITSVPVENSYFSSVSVAPDGSVYAAGQITGTGTYDFGNNVTATGASIGVGIVLVKYNSSGTAQWAKTVNAGNNSEFTCVSVASDGSVFAGGFIIGTSSYDFGNSVTAAGTAVDWNILLVKYNSSGVAQWARTVTAGGNDSLFRSVSVASDGSVYAAGIIERMTAYDFGNDITVTGAYNGSNLVLVKYNSSGVAQWAQTVTAGGGYSYFYSVSVASDGSVYAAGDIYGTSTYDFGNSVAITGTHSGSNILLVKYDSSGTVQWAQTTTVGSSNSFFYGVSVGSDGSVCAAGSIWGTSTYDFGNGVTVAGTYSGSNIVLVKYY